MYDHLLFIGRRSAVHLLVSGSVPFSLCKQLCFRVSASVSSPSSSATPIESAQRHDDKMSHRCCVRYGVWRNEIWIVEETASTEWTFKDSNDLQCDSGSHLVHHSNVCQTLASVLKERRLSLSMSRRIPWWTHALSVHTSRPLRSSRYGAVNDRPSHCLPRSATWHRC